jgi:hypothetical protein
VTHAGRERGREGGREGGTPARPPGGGPGWAGARDGWMDDSHAGCATVPLAM